jgi:hypothetical protein
MLRQGQAFARRSRICLRLFFGAIVETVVLSIDDNAVNVVTSAALSNA